MELTKRWRWLGIEFLVIALGVFSALAVDTWVEDRQNAKKEAIYRERLKADLERDVANMDAMTEYFGSVSAYGLMTLADLDGVKPLDDLQLMVAAFNAAEEWPFRTESSTYNDLQSTGGLSLLTDVQFRIDLADYHRISDTRQRLWDLPRAYRETARGIIPNKLQVAIHKACNASSGEDPSSGPLSAIEISNAELAAATDSYTNSATAEGFCGLKPEDFELSRAVAEFRSNPDMARQLRFRVSEINVAIALFKGQRELANELLLRLAESD